VGDVPESSDQKMGDEQEPESADKADTPTKSGRSDKSQAPSDHDEPEVYCRIAYVLQARILASLYEHQRIKIYAGSAIGVAGVRITTIENNNLQSRLSHKLALSLIIGGQYQMHENLSIGLEYGFSWLGKHAKINIFKHDIALRLVYQL
jgi:opacity protein-like surface antigen